MSNDINIIIATLAAAVIKNRQAKSGEDAVKAFYDVMEAYIGTTPGGDPKRQG